MRGGSGGDSPTTTADAAAATATATTTTTSPTVPAPKSLNIIMGDDSMSDDVFEQDDDENSTYSFASVALPPPPLPYDGAYSTGYRDFKPPPEITEYSRSRKNDNAWSCYRSHNQDNPETYVHKTILLGDSGVGKTSLLVQFDTGKFQHASFAATVGIGFTVILLGDSGVGKTCLLTRFRHGHFLGGNYISTVGIDFRNKMVNVDDTQVKLQIWDTAGQERFRSVTHAYYRDAHALLLLYDVTNKQSYDNIRAWLGEIREYAQDDVVIMLLGNKSDCGADRVVRREDGQRLANEYKVPFMETSAKTGLNVDLAFHAIAKDLKARAKKGTDPDGARFNVTDYLRDNQERSSSSSSCFNTSCLTI